MYFLLLYLDIYNDQEIQFKLRLLGLLEVLRRKLAVWESLLLALPCPVPRFLLSAPVCMGRSYAHVFGDGLACMPKLHSPAPRAVPSPPLSCGVHTCRQVLILREGFFKDLVVGLEIIMSGNLGSQVHRAWSRMEGWVRLPRLVCSVGLVDYSSPGSVARGGPEWGLLNPGSQDRVPLCPHLRAVLHILSNF